MNYKHPTIAPAFFQHHFWTMRLLIVKEFRETWPSWFHTFFLLGSTLVTLSVYWFTSRAFSGSGAITFQGNSYFSYVVLGELVLLIPTILFERFAQVVSEMASEKTLEIFSTYPTRPQTPILLLGIASIPAQVLNMLAMFVLAKICFGWECSWNSLILIFLFQVLVTPLFIGMGLLGAALVIRLGRGYSTLGYIGLLGNISAGVYFPLSVLPKTVAEILRWLSPFTIYLETVRHYFTSGWQPEMAVAFAKLLVLGVIILGIGDATLGISLQHLRRKGSLILSRASL